MRTRSRRVPLGIATALIALGMAISTGVAPSEAAMLYVDANYQGTKRGDATAASLPAAIDNKASSFKNYGYATTFYKGQGYSGTKWRTNSDYSNLASMSGGWNNVISSFKRG